MAINKLDPSIYNLISAGEVVENPASVVKELVENAIDAGATQISISIDGGGIERIKIIDNGCGMTKEDLYLSYLPHATSKISSSLDLDNISTLGFRGEALASIAAVSKLTIESKELNSDIGYMIKVVEGKIENEHEIGLSQGTCITVSNLFYNTPVRLKFLKSPKQEEANVTNKIKQLIFANPDVQFKYITDGKLVYQTAGGLEDAIYSIYGTQISNSLIPFDFSYNGYRAYGYTSNIDTTRANKQYQTIIVNGRAIINQNVQIAVMQAYGARLMKRTYPIYVINIIVPFDEIDVNVHPAKSEVRFRDDHKVFSCVYRAILSALDSNKKTVHLSDISDLETKHIFNEQNQTFVYSNDSKKQTFVQTSIDFNSTNNANLDLNFSLKTTDSSVNYNSKLENEKNTYNFSINDDLNIDLNISKLQKQDIISQNNTSNYENELNEDNYNYSILGQLFETYLILQDGDKAYLIDQHACHEKYLYEKLINNINNKDVVSQPLLLAYTYTCAPTQYDYMKNLQSNLNALGFEIEEFGNLTFKVNAMPVDLVSMNLDKFFEEILNDKSLIKSLKMADLISDKLAQYACKAAVKSGDSLSQSQIRQMFKDMKNGIPMQCPHGRPCIFEFSRNDLDKMFKRIE